jgi:hypothetical protein
VLEGAGQGNIQGIVKQKRKERNDRERGGRPVLNRQIQEMMARVEDNK